MNASREPAGEVSVDAVRNGVDGMLRFAAVMLRSGNTAARTRELLRAIAVKMGFDPLSVSISFDSVTLSATLGGERVTAMSEIGPPAVNADRIIELEQFAKGLPPGSSPRTVAEGLAAMEHPHRLHSSAAITASVGVASGGFAFLNGAAAPEIVAAVIGGGIGQYVRLWLSHRQLNQYGSATLAAIAAAGVYVFAAALVSSFGYGRNYGGGFIASVLFLVPGVPLIAGLFDLLQYQTVAAVSRLAYAVMILLAVALGLSIVVALTDIDPSRQPPSQLAYPLTLMLRALASFVAGAAFAMLFNSPRRVILAAGLLALVANGLRLLLNDLGIMLAPASFVAALTIGMIGVSLERRFDTPVMVTTVAPIVIMIPGVYAFEMIVLFNHGQMIEALQASASCGFVVGALAMGLAAARFFQPRTG